MKAKNNPKEIYKHFLDDKDISAHCATNICVQQKINEKHQ
jgi:hypothetical protein